MSVPKNPKIQLLIDEVGALQDDDKELEAKMQKIAEALAAEQQKDRPQAQRVNPNIPIDPADAFACEGCQ